MKSILITTAHRGVWYAEAPEDMDLTPKTLTRLQNCKMAIRWSTTRGLQELCSEGPNDNSKISLASGIHVLHDVTAVFEVSEEAAKVWKGIS